MNNEAEDRILSRPGRGDGSIPGQYVLEPYVCSEGNRMVRQAARKLSKVLLVPAVVLYFLTLRYLRSDLHNDLMGPRTTMSDYLVGFLVDFLTLSAVVALLVFTMVKFWFDSGSESLPSPVLPFPVKESLSYKTGVFSTRRYWITEDDIAEAVDGEVEFLKGIPLRSAGDDGYPAPARRQIKWVSGEDQEERTGLATMTRPDVVILTDEHDRRITPDMIAWHEDDEYEEAESENREPLKQENRKTLKPENFKTGKPGSNGESDQDETGGSTS